MDSITQRLYDINYEVKTLGAINALLEWDQSTAMPSGAVDVRAHQISYISKLAHEKLTGREMENELKKFVDLESGQLIMDDLDNKSKRNIHLLWKSWFKKKKLPASFVSEFMETKIKSHHAWEAAKKDDNFSIFEPWLEKVINLSKKEAQYFGIGNTLYDSLLDIYEPDMRVEELDPLFADLKAKTLELMTKISKAKESLKFQDVVGREFNVGKQFAFHKELVSKIGFDFNHGLMASSTHPFTTSFHPTDVRFTTRISKDNLLDGLYSTIHEMGHALYERGLPVEDYKTPIGSYASMGMHESQSRIWENCFGSHQAFWDFFMPLFKKHFGNEASGIEVKDLLLSQNNVRPSLIRTMSDEITYNLHIIVRYELEKEIINGDVKVKELPHLWNEKYQNYLGICANTFTEGILQDIHWAWACFGYFPSYSLGNLYAAGIYETICQDLDVADCMSKGEFNHINKWLGDKVHIHGSMYSSARLYEKIAGQKLDTGPFFRYLEDKYSKLYQIG